MQYVTPLSQNMWKCKLTKRSEGKTTYKDNLHQKYSISAYAIVSLYLTFKKMS